MKETVEKRAKSLEIWEVEMLIMFKDAIEKLLINYCEEDDEDKDIDFEDFYHEVDDEVHFFENTGRKYHKYFDEVFEKYSK